MKGLALVLFLGIFALPARAETEKKKERKEINFEGEVVEGAGRQSLDSLTQTAGTAKKSKVHLYEKREALKDRNLELVDEIIETY